MNTFRFDDTISFICCSHLEYKDGKFNIGFYNEGISLGVELDGKEYVMFLCVACGERIERKMFINFINNLKLNLRIKNGDVIELKSKNVWERLINILKVDKI